jgi:hypothetical protein
MAAVTGYGSNWTMIMIIGIDGDWGVASSLDVLLVLNSELPVTEVCFIGKSPCKIGRLYTL